MSAQPQNDGERIAALSAIVDAHNAGDLREFARIDGQLGDIRIDLNALSEKIGSIQETIWKAAGAVGAFSFVGSIVIALAIKHYGGGG